MLSRTAVAAIVLLQLIAGAALAQSDPGASEEFGRASGGDIGLLTKHSGTFSGSLGMNFGNGSKGVDGILGGALVADRLWFLATARHDYSRPPAWAFPQPAVSTMAADGKLTGVLSSHSFFRVSVFSRRSAAEPSLVMFKH